MNTAKIVLMSLMLAFVGSCADSMNTEYLECLSVDGGFFCDDTFSPEEVLESEEPNLVEETNLNGIRIGILCPTNCSEYGDDLILLGSIAQAFVPGAASVRTFNITENDSSTSFNGPMHLRISWNNELPWQASRLEVVTWDSDEERWKLLNEVDRQENAITFEFCELSRTFALVEVGIETRLDKAPSSCERNTKKSTPISVFIENTKVDRASRAAINEMFSDMRTHGADMDMEMLIPTVHLTMVTNIFGGVEYSYRINGSRWSIWTQGGDELVFRDISMALSGHYNIDAKARSFDNPSDESINYARTTVTIDDVPPTVAMTRDGNIAIIVAEDELSFDSLRVRARVNFGDWQSLPAGESEIDLGAAAGGNAHVEVEARDGHDNVTVAARTFNMAGITIENQTNSGARNENTNEGCTISPNKNTSSSFYLLSIIMLLFSSRKRRV